MGPPTTPNPSTTNPTTAPTVFHELQDRQAQWQARFGHPLPLGVKKKLVVLTCMDSRVPVERILGLELGDAEVIRNAGGRVTADVLRSLVVCQDLLGCHTVVVMHHTDCGGQEAARRHQELQGKLWGHYMRSPSAGWWLRGATYVAYYAATLLPRMLRRKVFDAVVHPIYDLPTSVRADVRALRASPVVHPTTSLYGCVYRVEDGGLDVVARDVGTVARGGGGGDKQKEETKEEEEEEAQ